jgi:hypothetical protein
MWEQSLLTSVGQVQALRLLSEWWDASRRSRPSWRPRRAVGAAADATVADGRPDGTRVVAGAAPTGP